MEHITVAVRNLFEQAQAARLSHAVEGFVAVELAGSSPITEAWYAGLLRRMASELGDARVVDLQPFEVALWGRQTLARAKSPYTAAGYILAAKRFFRWLVEVNLATVDLGSQLKRGRLPKGTRPGVREEDARRIVEAARGNPRDFALILFLQSTGCRREGIANLETTDLELEQEDEKLRRRARVREKFAKERVVFFDEETRLALLAWIPLRPMGYECNVFGLGPAGVSGVLRRYKERLGIEGSVSPHQWRHRWARKMIQGGMGIGQVAELLGHQSIKTTHDFYGRFSIDQLQEVFDRVALTGS